MLETIIKGGSMMVPLMLQSVLAVAVVIDRWIAFSRNDKVDSRSLRSKVLELLAAGKVGDATALCANTPGQMAIQTALGGYQSIKDLVAPGGRLCRQRDLAYQLLTQIPGVSVVKPKAALYMFPRLDPKLYPIADDQQFAYELLAEQKVLIVQGTGFNWPEHDHFRLVFLPNVDDLTEAIGRIERFLHGYRKRHSA